jgi:transposase
MSTRHTMRKLREVLRLHYEFGCTHREIHASTGLSKGSVSDYPKRASAAGLTWESARDLDDAGLEARVFKQIGRNEPPARIPIDFEWVHRELRETGVTLQTLWVDYQERAGLCGSSQRAYQYSQFCDLYAAWKSKLAIIMRQTIAPATRSSSTTRARSLAWSTLRRARSWPSSSS